MNVEKSEIIIEREVRNVAPLVADKFVLTDDNVMRIYGGLLQSAKRVCVIPHGEDSKTLETAETVLREMAEERLDRKSKLVAFGGGVVGDLGGFCAAVYMRGINFINVPTTLLAQLDSSIGGKTGVDLTGYKNMVGAFHLPERVHICTDFLKTLPKREVSCGLGEAVKTALLDERCMKVWTKYTQGEDKTDFFALVESCARFKESVTNADFKESGRRKILNLGHTVGHVLEYLDSHEKSHGEYVALGLLAEAAIAHDLGVLTKESREFIEKKVSPIVDRDGRKLFSKFSAEEIARAATADKKNSEGKISIIVSERYRQTEFWLTERELAAEAEKCLSSL